jgi:hypothetical protein
MSDEPTTTVHDEDLAPEEEAAESVTGGSHKAKKGAHRQAKATESAPCTDVGVAVDPFGGSGVFNV